jgi:hypothetical protein
VNSVVSLAKARPMELLDSEIAAVQQALDAHPKARKYRKDVKPRQITIYEAIGPDLGQLRPIMRFTLLDRKNRLFEAERMCYRGGMEDWIDIAFGKPIDELCLQLIPKLGTEEFFELF